MEKEERPRRPLTPFFLYREQEKERGNSMGGADAGERWRSMAEEEKQPFLEQYKKAREKYDEYLISKGIPTKSSSKKKGRLVRYHAGRMKTLCSKLKADKNVYKGFCKAAEKFMLDLSETVATKMKDEDRRIVTVDIIANVLDQPRFDFLNSVKEFDAITAEAERAVQDESERRSQAKKKSDTEDNKKKSKKKRTNAELALLSI